MEERTIGYEEAKIRKMILLECFKDRKAGILSLIQEAKKEKSGGAMFGIYLRLKTDLPEEEKKMIFPEEFE